MQSHAVAMQSTGLIGVYTQTIHGQRGRDRGKAFSGHWGIPEHPISIEEATNHPEVDTVGVGLPNFLHEEPIEDQVYTPKTLKAIDSERGGEHRRRHLGPIPGDPPRPA